MKTMPTRRQPLRWHELVDPTWHGCSLIYWDLTEMLRRGITVFQRQDDSGWLTIDDVILRMTNGWGTWFCWFWTFTFLVSSRLHQDMLQKPRQRPSWRKSSRLYRLSWVQDERSLRHPFGRITPGSYLTSWATLQRCTFSFNIDHKFPTGPRKLKPFLVQK